MSRILPLSALLLIASCAPFAPAPPVSPAVSAAGAPTPRAAGSAPDGSGRVSRDALVEACRREATRVVLYRDRGQQMRTDEGDNRVGVQANIPTLRAETDRLAQQYERDRLTDECVRRYTGEEALGRRGGGAIGAPAPASSPGRPAGGRS